MTASSISRIGIDRLVRVLIDDIGPGYDVTCAFEQNTRICGEKDGWVEREIVPGTQKITLVITPRKVKDE